MKTCLATCACALLLIVSAGAIPQTFQQPTNVFLRTAGVNFEDFASDPGSWDASTGLKGHWVAKGDTLTLTDSAAVFGIAADSVTAQQKDGRVESFRVLFRAGDKKTGKPADLEGQLTANVRAFTGDSGAKLSAGAATFKYKDVTITLSTGSGRDVVVEFKRG